MKHFTDIIPPTLAEKLKEKGMPITYSYHPHQIAPDVRGIVMGNFKEIDCPIFATCFDWLMGKGYAITVYGCGSGYHWLIDKECDNSTRGTHITQSMCGDGPNDGGCWDTWHEAANAAIEKAITLI